MKSVQWWSLSAIHIVRSMANRLLSDLAFFQANLPRIYFTHWGLLLSFIIGLLPIASLAENRIGYLKPNFRAPYIDDLKLETQEPQVFFEVTKPVERPKGIEPCVVLLLNYSFGNTINLPPVATKYTPDYKCGSAWEKVILRWSAACKGRQFDRISAIWLSGVEIFRTCTAEPTKQGIFWEVEKDITKYSSLLREPQTLVVSLANVVDKTYTGIFNVTITAEFYKLQNSASVVSQAPDVIFPISLPSSQNGGHWFQLQNESDVKSSWLTVPRTTFKAVLEVCISFHSDDEFWYTNPSNEYLDANNLTDPGNGAFREVIVFLDGIVAGVICPFPVVYTGGINPLFWRPAAAIGAYNLPSYDVDLTPFLGLLLDGKKHEISMTVRNALSTWLLDANLHLWLDPEGTVTTGKLLTHNISPLNLDLSSNFKGLDGSIGIEASHSVTYSGSVNSSHGCLVTSVTYGFQFSNSMAFSRNASKSVIKQLIKSTGRVVTKNEHMDIASEEISNFYPLQMLTDQYNGPNKTTSLDSSLSHAFNQNLQMQSVVEPAVNIFSILRNSQNVAGKMTIRGNLVQSGYGALKQDYTFESTEDCYFRKLSTWNYTILSDDIGDSCLATL